MDEAILAEWIDDQARAGATVTESDLIDFAVEHDLTDEELDEVKRGLEESGMKIQQPGEEAELPF